MKQDDEASSHAQSIIVFSHMYQTNPESFINNHLINVCTSPHSSAVSPQRMNVRKHKTLTHFFYA